MLRKNWLFILLFLFFALPFPLLSEQLELEFLEGRLEVKIGSRWVEAKIGDLIPLDTSIRVGNDTIVELSGDNSRITVSIKGTFSVSDLLMKASNTSGNLWTFLKHALKAVSGKFGTHETSVTLGVRGDAAEGSELAWMDEEEEILEEGKALLGVEKYKEAVQHFREALEEADEAMIQQYRFYMGCGYAMRGQKGAALKTLSTIKPDPADSCYEDWVLLKGQLLYESLAFDRALDIFKSYLDRYPEGSTAQTAYLFSGLCHLELGNKSAAQTNFSRAYKIDPNSEMGKVAESRLGN